MLISQCATILDNSRESSPSKSIEENGQQQQQDYHRVSFLSGMKQRLLSFIFRGLWSEEADCALVNLC